MGKVSSLLLATTLLTSITLGNTSIVSAEEQPTNVLEVDKKLTTSEVKEVTDVKSEELETESKELDVKEEPKKEPQKEPIKKPETQPVKEKVNEKTKVEENKGEVKKKLETKEEPKKVDYKVPFNPKPIKDLYLSVKYMQEFGTLKDNPLGFVLQIKDSKGNVIGKTIPIKFNEAKGEKPIAVKVSLSKELSYGDKYSIGVDGSTKTFGYIDIETNNVKDKDFTTKTVTIKDGTKKEMKVNAYLVEDIHTSTDESKKKAYYVLEGSKNNPLQVYPDYDKSKTEISILGLKGKQIKVQIDNKEYKVDSNGNVIVPTKNGKHTINTPKGYYFSKGSRKLTKSATQMEDYGMPTMVIKMTTDKAESNNLVNKYEAESPEVTTTTIKVNTKSHHNDLTTDWLRGIVKLTPVSKEAKKQLGDTVVEYHLGGEIVPLEGLPKGKYKVEFKSDTANYSKVGEFTQGTKSEMVVSATPKYLLKVNKEGKKFTFLTDTKAQRDAQFSSTGAELEYGVLPDMAMAITDKADTEVYNVNIDRKHTNTTLVLGQGVVIGSNITTPHTGDSAIYMVGLLLLTVIMFGAFFLINRNRNNHNDKNNKGQGPKPPTTPPTTNTKKAMTSITALMLVVSTLSTTITPTQVLAASGGGNKGDGGGKSPAANGVIGTRNDVSILSASIEPAYQMVEGKKVWSLADDSTLKDASKLKTATKRLVASSFLMPINTTSATVLKSNSTSIAVHDGRKLTRVLGAKDPLKLGYIADDDAGNNYVKGAKEARILPVPENAVKSTNLYTAYLGFTAMSLNGNKKTRALWKKSGASGNKSTSDYDYGKIANLVYKDIKGYSKKYSSKSLEGKNLKLLTSGPNGKLNTQKIFDAYLRKLDSASQKDHKEKLELLEEDANDKELERGMFAVYYQSYSGYQVMKNNRFQGGTLLMSLSSASNWYLQGMMKSRRAINTSLQDLYYNHSDKEERVIDWGGNSAGLSSSDSISKKFPTYSFPKITRETSRSAIKPRSKNYTESDYTGWGYQNMKGISSGSVNTPVLKIKVRYKNNSTGKLTAYKYLEGYGGSKGIVINKFDGLKELGIYGETNEFQDSKLIKVDVSKDIEMKLKATQKIDGKAININYSDVKNLKGAEETTSIKNTVATDSIGTFWQIRTNDQGRPSNLVSMPELNNLLGGLDENSDADWFKKHKKLFPYTPKKGKTVDYSDATMYLTLSADYTTLVNKANVELTTPEWATSMYYPTLNESDTGGKVGDKEIVVTEFKLSPSSSSSYSIITPSTTRFNPMDDYDKSHLMLQGVYDEDYLKKYGLGSLGQTQYTAHGNTVRTSSTAKALPIKSNKDGFKTKLASWVNNYNLFEGRIGQTSDAVGEYVDETVKIKDTKKDGLAIFAQSPYVTYHHAYTYTVCGRWSCWDVGTSETLTPTYKKPNYTITNVYDVYKADKQKEADIPAYDEDKDSENGTLLSTRQTEEELSLVPEVAMQTYDMYGNSSVNFYAGEYKRTLQPMTFTTAKFKDIQVSPSVEGASVATDAEAKALASRLKANTKSVIYKGSALNMSFKTEGRYEVKNYVLDIGNSGLKNAWDNNYSTNKIVEDSMVELGFKPQGKGNFLAPLQFNGSLYYDESNWGGKSKVIDAEQTKDQEVEEYKLEVRSGVLIAVDGDYNFRETLKTKNPELLKALDSMSLSTALDKNVFNPLKTDEGAKLTNRFSANTKEETEGSKSVSAQPAKSADDFVANANRVRHVDKHGSEAPMMVKEDNWYNEDTTILVVREFTNTFKIPTYMYTDKLPLKVPGLETPMDKIKFFTQGTTGHTELTIKLNSEEDSFMTFNSSPGFEESIKGTVPSTEYVVPNVSIMDTMQ